mmetsp:Transcript_8547/g.18629  ORF Transcript_8547/g.18629 Transcript_8547/m.18629 type:complete len:334 (+) Transcript_8547:344-1345(+)
MLSFFNFSSLRSIKAENTPTSRGTEVVEPPPQPTKRRAVYRTVERHITLQKVRPSERLGINFSPPHRPLPRGLPTSQIVILSVGRDSAAEHAGLGAFDVIKKINGQKPTSPQQAAKLLRAQFGYIDLVVRQCPPQLHVAALKIQSHWRHTHGLFCVSVPESVLTPLRSADAVDIESIFGLSFSPEHRNAAIVGKVDSQSPLRGMVHTGDALILLDGGICSEAMHAVRLGISFAKSRTRRTLVLVFKRAAAVDGAMLRTMAEELPAVRMSDPTEDCPVCFEEMEEPLAWGAGCGHRFCQRCTHRCRQRSESCPICRLNPRDRSATPALLAARAR